MNNAKNLKIVCFLAFFTLTGISKAQEMPIEQIREIIKAGSSKELSKFLATSVDVRLENKVDDAYSKSQAEFLLRDFFKQHPPKDFTLGHQGSSKGGDQSYATGTYLSGNETYNFWVKFKKYPEGYMVNYIAFMKE